MTPIGEGTPINWQYEYTLKDHLGNGRVYFADVGNNGTVEVLQESHYYPFGMQMQGISANSSPNNPYQYNGKELNVDLGLYWSDYGARWQDPQLGRWWSVDPLAENHFAKTPYNYVLNNPMLFIDPDGRDTSFVDNSARQLFNDTYERVNKSIAIYDSKISKTKKEKKRQRLENTKSKLTDIKKSFDEVIGSEQMFEFSTKPNPDGAHKQGGGTVYNPETGNVEVSMFEGLDETLVHETRHAAGYLRNEWGWDTETGVPTYYDYQDEYEAYVQGDNYNQIIWNGSGKSEEQRRDYVKDNYTEIYIIKEFKQYKVPK